ncbi:MAG: hypothetical protein KGR18_01900 [Acidobacteria bacterium]|nr:hypothetical protein [Acidobacteriota bacterium]
MEEPVEISTPEVDWRFDRGFLESNWTCIWGRGCLGILDEPAEDLGQGCCSVGAEFGDQEEAMFISAMAAMLDPERFQHHDVAARDGIFSDEQRTNTRVHDGACIFLNRPDFAGGAGCALHLAALDADESPLDWKPSVCWQLPIRVDWEPLEEGRERATLRRWSRADWGDEGATMAWCCTEGDRAYVGDRPVVETLATELAAITGEEVFVELRRRLGR